MTHLDLAEKIEKLDDIIEIKEKEFELANQISFNSFADYKIFFYNRQKYCEPEFSQRKEYIAQYRMICPYTLSSIPTYGTIMSLTDFIDCVNSGGFIDYDGYGNYIINDQCTDLEIYPSDVKNKLIRSEFDKIIWFNR